MTSMEATLGIALFDHVVIVLLRLVLLITVVLINEVLPVLNMKLLS